MIPFPEDIKIYKGSNCTLYDNYFASNNIQNAVIAFGTRIKTCIDFFMFP